MSIIIRPESTTDEDAIRHVNRLAFGQDEEARLVAALRDGGYFRVSLVAEASGQIVGHILFSDLPIITGTGTVTALALAPMAVLPELQGRGSARRWSRGAGSVPTAGPSDRRRPGPCAFLPTVRVLADAGCVSGVSVFGQ